MNQGHGGRATGRTAPHKFQLALDVLYWARFGGYQPLPELEVVLWAISHRYPPTVEEIRDRWGVSRATAFRHRVLLEDVHTEWARRMRGPGRCQAAHTPPAEVRAL